jgi:plasmid stabilization system protein ParE
VRLRILDSARNDIAQIFAFIEQSSGSSVIAESFARQLTDQCQRLAELSGTLGRPRPELRRDIRSTPFKNYLIFFRYVGDVLEVVNILEGHRDIDAFFGDGER